MGRNLTRKECHIEKACLFFIVEFMYQFKMQLEVVVGGEVNIAELLSYLRQYTQLSSLYFIQENRMLDYLIDLL